MGSIERKKIDPRGAFVIKGDSTRPPRDRVAMGDRMERYRAEANTAEPGASVWTEASGRVRVIAKTATLHDAEKVAHALNSAPLGGGSVLPSLECSADA